MSEQITITREESGGKGRYIARVAGFDEPGEMTFRRVSPDLIIVDHTGAPDSLRGKGVGMALANRVIADARAEGFKIAPLCRFLAAQAERHPEWSDVIQRP
jgi:predicted GNAT family acetyltransferase